jgi:hypothetical protein
VESDEVLADQRVASHAALAGERNEIDVGDAERVRHRPPLAAVALLGDDPCP